MEEIIVAEGLDPRKAKEYRIIDNKTFEYANWDKNLKFELKEFSNLEMIKEFFPDAELDRDFGNLNFKEYSNEDIRKTSDMADNKFAELRKERDKELVKIVCPHCLEEFQQLRGDLLRMRGVDEIQ